MNGCNAAVGGSSGPGICLVNIPFVAIKAWAGFKGSFDGLRVSNLIRFWKDRYHRFFRAVELYYALCRNIRKKNRLRRKRIKELAAAFGVERKEVQP